MSEEAVGAISKLEGIFGLELSAEQKRRMRVYIELLQRWNRRVNLTSIDRVEDQLRFSFFEAFWATQEFLGPATRLCDVGSGAGFPGLAMKIYRPALRVTLVEPVSKKAVFLKEAARALDVTAEVFNGKGEDYAGWAGVELASFRALRPGAALLERLGRAGVRLLLFEGPEGLGKDATVERRLLVPGSRQRYVTLARPCSALG